MHEVVLRAENLGYTLGNDIIFRDINLQVGTGKIYAVRIPKREGNTILSKLFAGLLKPTSGKLTVFFKEWDKISISENIELRTRVGYQFSSGVMINNKSVYDNLALSLRYHNLANEEEIEDRIYKYSDMLGISNYMFKMPIDINPVERKLIHICSVAIREPELIIADEPFSQLSMNSAPGLSKLYRQLNRDNNTTIVLVTSTLVDLESLIDEVCFIKDGKVERHTSFEDIGGLPDVPGETL